MNFKIIFWNRCFSALSAIIYLALFLLFAIIPLHSINHLSFITLNGETWKNVKLFLTIFCLIGLFFSLFLFVTCLSIDKQQFLKFKIHFFLLSVISFNFFLIFINAVFNILEKKQNEKFNFNLMRKKWPRFKTLTIMDITLIGVFSALVVIGNWFEMTIHFLPYGAGGLNVKYMFVMIIAFLNSTFSGFLTGAIGSLMSLLFIGGDLIISPWSYLLDYFLPTISPCICGWFYFWQNQENKKLNYLNYVLMIALSYFLIWFWQSLSGYLIWIQLYPLAWGGQSRWLYPLIFNGISIWVFSYPLTQVLLPIIIRRLRPLLWKH